MPAAEISSDTSHRYKLYPYAQAESSHECPAADIKQT